VTGIGDKINIYTVLVEKSERDQLDRQGIQERIILK
jgi:hypothetical protein